MPSRGWEVSEATERIFRTALENLLKAIAFPQNPNIKVIHEPKKDKTGLGTPDFKFKLSEATVGSLANKKIGKDLRARLDPDKAEKVAGLIADFLSTPPEKLGNAKQLSTALFVRCHELRDFLLEELERQDKEQRQGRLYGLYHVFKKDVFYKLALKELADAFAQTLGYGLFLAKPNTGEHAAVTLQNAKNYIPANFALIRRVGGLSGRAGTGRISGHQMAGGRNPQHSEHAGPGRYSRRLRLQRTAGSGRLGPPRKNGCCSPQTRMYIFTRTS